MTTAQECDAALAKPFVIIFKHSRVCSVSSYAKAEVSSYCRAHPDTPVYMVVAQQSALAQHVARATGVPHASPQVIVLRNSEVVGVTSHFGITYEALEDLADAEPSR